MAEYIGKYHYGVLRNPTHPGATISAPMLSANGKYCYMFGSNRVISSLFGYSYTWGDGLMIPVMKWLNGYCYFGAEGIYLWYSTTWSSWVVTTTTPGIPPVETWVWDDDTETTGEYTGDNWYSGTLPSFGSTSSFVARGALRGTTQGSYSGTPIDVGTVWEYWKRETEITSPVGTYLPQGAASGNIIIGLPQFNGSNNNTYIRSLIKSGGYYNYGSIYYDTTHSKWIYGTYGSDSGWHEGSEPDINSSVTFTFTKNEGSEATGDDFTVSFDQYVLGTNTQDSYLFNVGKWHI